MARLDGKWKANPTYPESQKSDARIVVAGTIEGICMVEGSAAEISEAEFVDVLFQAHEKIKKIVQWQHDMQKEVGIAKEAITDEYNFERVGNSY